MFNFKTLTYCLAITFNLMASFPSYLSAGREELVNELLPSGEPSAIRQKMRSALRGIPDDVVNTPEFRSVTLGFFTEKDDGWIRGDKIAHLSMCPRERIRPIVNAIYRIMTRGDSRYVQTYPGRLISALKSAAHIEVFTSDIITKLSRGGDYGDFYDHVIKLPGDL